MDNNKILPNSGLTFDDVLLLPSHTEVKREEIDLSTYLTENIKLQIPLLSSPMDTVTTAGLAIALSKLGGIGFIHRNMTVEKQAEEVAKAKKGTDLVGAAVGVGKDMQERVKALVENGCDVILVDSAHGYSKWVIEVTKYIAQTYKNTPLVSGNVATAAGAKALVEAGAQGIRVGMGPGSICTTRIVAGIGVPQVTAVMDVYGIAKTYCIPVISDGGIRYSGDITKAISSGASTVMIGSLFAASLEAPGELKEIKGKKCKIYRGMGSVSAMKEGSSQRYGQEYRKGQEKKLIAEGVEGTVPYKGTLEEIVTRLTGGLRTGMYYTGVKNIKELQEKTRLIRITQASLIESHPHDIKLNE